MIAFHWSLSEGKSPQVSRTLLSILADRSNAVVWTLSTLPVISKFCSHCTNSFGTVPKTSITIDIIITFMFHSFFQFPSKVEVLHPSFHILSVLFCGPPGQQSPQSCKFSIFFYYYKVWSFRRDQVIRLDLKITKGFGHLILQDRFRVVHIPFVRLVEL